MAVGNQGSLCCLHYSCQELVNLAGTHNGTVPVSLQGRPQPSYGAHQLSMAHGSWGWTVWGLDATPAEAISQVGSVHPAGPEQDTALQVGGAAGEGRELQSLSSSPLLGYICVSSRETLVCSLERTQKLPN